MFKESIINECISIMKRDDIRSELKTLLTPLIDLILIQIYPYLYLSLMFVLISFLLHLGIFVLLLRNKTFLYKQL